MDAANPPLPHARLFITPRTQSGQEPRINRDVRAMKRRSREHRIWPARADFSRRLERRLPAGPDRWQVAGPPGQHCTWAQLCGRGPVVRRVCLGSVCVQGGDACLVVSRAGTVKRTHTRRQQAEVRGKQCSSPWLLAQFSVCSVQVLAR